MRRFVCSLLALTVAVGLSWAADPQLLSKVPGKPDALVGMDLTAIMSSRIVQQVMQDAKTSPSSTAGDINDFIATTGLDPRRDVKEIVVAAFPSKKAPAKPGAPPPSEAVVLMTGTFNPARLGSALASKGATKALYRGKELWTPDKKTNKDGDVVSFLSSSLVVAGNPDRVKQVIDGQASAVPAEMQRRVTDVSSRYDVWMVSAISPAKMADSLDAPGAAGQATGALQGDMFQKIESAQGGVKFGPTMNIGLEMNAATAEDATALMNVLQFFRSMLQSGGAGAKGKAAEVQSLAKMLNTINMRTQANTLSLSMELAEDDVINFMKTAQKKAAEAATEKPQPQQEEIVIIQ